MKNSVARTQKTNALRRAKHCGEMKHIASNDAERVLEETSASPRGRDRNSIVHTQTVLVLV